LKEYHRTLKNPPERSESYETLSPQKTLMITSANEGITKALIGVDAELFT